MRCVTIVLVEASVLVAQINCIHEYRTVNARYKNLNTEKSKRDKVISSKGRLSN